MAKDLLEKLGDYRQKRVMDLSDQQVIRLQKSLQELENLVIKEASKIDPTRGSLKLRTTVALQMRPKLKQYIEQTYLNTVQQNISEYDKSASWLVGTFKEYPIPDEFKEITELDLTTIQQLKRGAYLPFEDLGSEFVNELSQEVYNSTLTGKPTEQMIADLRGKINGVYQSTDNEEAQELVDFIANNPDKTEAVKTATERLQTIYGRDRLGNNFRRYATQLVQDSLMGFDGQFAKYRADELGLTHYVYTGTTVRDSRDFCRRNVGKIYSEEEIRDIWSSQSWNGKAQGDPFIVRGGYNCRHHWQPTDPEWGKEDDDFPTTEDIKQQDQTIEEQTTEETKSILPNVPIASLLNRGSVKTRKAYEDQFNSQLTDQQKRIVSKYPKPSVIKNGKKGVYYYRSQEMSAELNAIDKSRNSKTGVKSFVMSHEYGHHIDYVSFDVPSVAWSESSFAFSNAIKLDRQRFKGTGYKNLKTGEIDDYYVISSEELDKISKELATKENVDIIRNGRKVANVNVTNLKGDGYGEVSDIVDALARGRFRKDFNMWGHTVSYYSKKGAVEKEIFANLFSIRHNKKAYDQAKKYIPNTVKEFEKRLLELEKGN
jgi:hypothetical protein